MRPATFYKALHLGRWFLYVRASNERDVHGAPGARSFSGRITIGRNPR